jgi:hypothetical protein
VKREPCLGVVEVALDQVANQLESLREGVSVHVAVVRGLDVAVGESELGLEYG